MSNKIGIITCVLLCASLTLNARNSARNQQDLSRIYLYTNIVFMHQMQQQPKPSTTVKAWQAAFKDLKLAAKEYDDYQAPPAQIKATLLRYFTPQEQLYLKKENILQDHSPSALLFYYELSYLEHPLGGYQYFSHLSHELDRLSYVFGSSQYAKLLLATSSPLYRYLALWSAVVAEQQGAFDRLFDQHIAEFNAQLSRTQ